MQRKEQQFKTTNKKTGPKILNKKELRVKDQKKFNNKQNIIQLRSDNKQTTNRKYPGNLIKIK